MSRKKMEKNSAWIKNLRKRGDNGKGERRPVMRAMGSDSENKAQRFMQATHTPASTQKNAF
jgi:hypothetical protein